MTATTRFLASGPGWQADDVICTSGPHDRPFEEQHNGICIAAVTQGTFQYRSTQGSALLTPGALLLGQDRHCFECGHDHGTGDRCLSFHFTPAFFHTVAGTRPITTPNLPPLPTLIPIIAAAEAARDDADPTELAEIAVRLAGAVATTLTGTTRPTPTRRDERRITDAIRLIEQSLHDPIPLTDLATQVAMSPYHFLRTFRSVVGLTPHQFVLRTRLHEAAVSLRRSDDSISTIAFASGFNDLSTFNRRFRRFMGVSPSTYRTRAASER
ncbi:AraC family transcriptional regulator [Acidisphaera sp. S103]|uniref:AraC family transcriptional regulator n=1 Tax=Acidisphaera sp. S103 TaxID=1747223 RepID=UPI00131E348A|nr:AraC family transcriptional regulator [Acidisphaera sp. S103]